VLASHRSVVLHAMGALMADSHAISRRETVLPIAPMFHVNAWGLPFSTALAPAKLVLPGRDLRPAALARLVEAERVTVAAAVPTVWLALEEAFEAGEHDLSSLRTALCGGAAASSGLIERYVARGLDFLHAWGMTEMSPSGTVQRVPAHAPPEAVRATQGYAVPGVELRLVGEDGAVPWDGESVGELEVRGPWIARAYHDPDDDANESRFHDGWLRTEDLAHIAPDGEVEVVDRMKDLVKSGGEWISSLELETLLVEHPGVAEAAVIAVPDERWGERPLAVVVADLAPDELRAYLEPRVASWWLPDTFEVVPELPKTSVGKVDKQTLRARYATTEAPR